MSSVPLLKFFGQLGERNLQGKARLIDSDYSHAVGRYAGDPDLEFAVDETGADTEQLRHDYSLAFKVVVLSHAIIIYHLSVIARAKFSDFRIVVSRYMTRG